MSLVQPVSGLQVPTWSPFWNAEKTPVRWFPPNHPDERHPKKPVTPATLFEGLIAWLEDSPADKPFLDPSQGGELKHPATGESVLERTRSDGTAAQWGQETLGYEEAAPVPATESSASTVRRWDAELMDEVSSAVNSAEPQRVLDAVLFHAGKAEFFLRQGMAYHQRVAVLLNMLRPLETQPLDNLTWLRLWAIDLWKSKMIETFISISSADPARLAAKSWALLILRVCRPNFMAAHHMPRSVRPPHMDDDADFDTPKIVAWTYDATHYWLRNIQALAEGIRRLDEPVKQSLCKQMEGFLQDRSMSKLDESPMNTQVGWIMLLSLGCLTSRDIFLETYRNYLASMASKAGTQEASLAFLLTLASIKQDLFTWKEMSAVIRHRDNVARWAMLLQVLRQRGAEGRSLLPKIWAEWKNLGICDNVVVSDMLKTPLSAYPNSAETLAQTAGNHTLALRMFAADVACRGSAITWHWQTWATITEAMLMDPLIHVLTIKDLHQFMLVSNKQGSAAAQEERMAKAEHIERICETLCQRVTHVGIPRLWTFLLEFNNLCFMLRGNVFSPVIISLMVDVATRRMTQGELVTRGQLIWLRERLKETHGEATAREFVRMVTHWESNIKRHWSGRPEPAIPALTRREAKLQRPEKDSHADDILKEREASLKRAQITQAIKSCRFI